MIPYHVIYFHWYDGRLFSGKPRRYCTVKMPEREQPHLTTRFFGMVQQLKVRPYNYNPERKIVTIYCQTFESQNQQNRIVKTKESQDKSKIIKLPILQYLHK